MPHVSHLGAPVRPPRGERRAHRDASVTRKDTRKPIKRLAIAFVGLYVVPVTQNGAAIRSIREARGLSLRRLARLVGFSPSKLSRIETGKRGAAPEDIRSIATALDTPTEAITRESP